MINKTEKDLFSSMLSQSSFSSMPSSEASNDASASNSERREAQEDRSSATSSAARLIQAATSSFTEDETDAIVNNGASSSSASSNSGNNDSDSDNNVAPSFESIAECDKEMIDALQQQYGALSPKIAEHLNSLGLRHYHSDNPNPNIVSSQESDSPNRTPLQSALQCHRQALTILDWNKCNALLFDRISEAKSYAVDMAITLSDIGNVLREMNDFLSAAAAYKECLDLFLEGLVEEGGSIKRRLLDMEHDLARDVKEAGEGYEGYDSLYVLQESRVLAELSDVDRQAIGETLSHHPGYRLAVRGISNLLREMQYVKFVAQNAASSRRRRRRVQQAKAVRNLNSAIASLSVFHDVETSVAGGTNTNSTSDGTSPMSNVGEEAKTFTLNISPNGSHDRSTSIGSVPSIVHLTRSKSWASQHSTDEEVRRKRTTPLTVPSRIADRSKSTSHVTNLRKRAAPHQEACSTFSEYDETTHTSYFALSQNILPAEHLLQCALNRFPGVTSILVAPPRPTPVVKKVGGKHVSRGSKAFLAEDDDSFGFGGNNGYGSDGIVDTGSISIHNNRSKDSSTKDTEGEVDEDEVTPHLLTSEDDEEEERDDVEKAPPPPQDLTSPRSIKSNIYENFSNDFLSYSISCGGGMKL